MGEFRDKKFIENGGEVGPFTKRGSGVVVLDTDGAITFTVAQLQAGLILRDPVGSARADLVPLAADILAAQPDVIPGDSFDFTIRNTADGNETITLTTNTGVTMSGTMTIAQNNSKTFRCVCTGAATCTVYSLGTVVH